MTWTETGALVGSITGIAGCVLGVLNYSLQRRVQAIRIKVDLAHVEKRGDRYVAIVGKDSNLLLPCAVHVCNESNFEVTITEVGVRVKLPEQTTLSPVSPRTLDGLPLPHRLAPRQSCSVPLGNADAWDLASRDVDTVFVKLDTGAEFRIDSMRLLVLKKIGPIIRKARDDQQRETV